MNKLADELQHLRFNKRGIVKLDKRKLYPTFQLELDLHKDGNGVVYMWVVEKKGQPVNIVYIGKTGKSLFDRCNQHESGFRNSKRGKELAKTLFKLLSGGETIALYCRKSAKRTIFGIKVSLCDAEENALIKKFYNSHKLLNITGKDGKLGFDEAIELLAGNIQISG